MAPIRIGYNKLWGVFFLIAGAVDLVVYTSVRASLHLVLGGLLLLIGALYLTRPFLVIGNGAVRVKNLLGITMRSFSFDSLRDLRVEPDAIVIGEGRDRKRLKLSKLLIARADLDRLEAAVKDASPQ
jgi:hypothetical protein